MSSRVNVIAVTDSAVFFGMKEPVNECLVYEISCQGSPFVIVNGEYYGSRLPYDDVNRLYNINKELAMIIYDILKEEYPDHDISRLFLAEIEELIEDDG